MNFSEASPDNVLPGNSLQGCVLLRLAALCTESAVAILLLPSLLFVIIWCPLAASRN